MADTPPRPGKSLGKGMLALGWIVALGILTLIFGNWEEKQYNPNQQLAPSNDSQIKEVVLQANRAHHYVATGSINGVEVVFLVDTGATDVVVPAALTTKLGLRAGARGLANTANGTVEIRSTEIAELRLGPLLFNNVRASLNPGMTGDEVLLGMSALKQVELTQRNNQLILRQLPLNQ